MFRPLLIFIIVLLASCSDDKEDFRKQQTRQVEQYKQQTRQIEQYKKQTNKAEQRAKEAEDRTRFYQVLVMIFFAAGIILFVAGTAIGSRAKRDARRRLSND
ncbi:MAG: hypothetical protein HRT89_24430 [Lentisphaeria bacterium]|nr:hypothetical protein [Lentisphaeria bacterium]NQZ71204.1 hypothetical protein [Lentisphaeria bacterium]